MIWLLQMKEEKKTILRRNPKEIRMVCVKVLNDRFTVAIHRFYHSQRLTITIKCIHKNAHTQWRMWILHELLVVCQWKKANLYTFQMLAIESTHFCWRKSISNDRSSDYWFSLYFIRKRFLRFNRFAYRIGLRFRSSPLCIVCLCVNWLRNCLYIRLISTKYILCYIFVLWFKDIHCYFSFSVFFLFSF